MLVAVVCDVGNGGQILAYQLPQDARSRAVQDSHARHAYEDGIVDEIGDGVDGLVASHTAHVEVLSEVQFAVVYHLAGVLRYHPVRACDIVVALLGLRELRGGFLGAFQTVGTHLRTHAAEDDHRLTAVDAFNLADGREAFDAHGVAGLQLRVGS